MAIDDVLTEIRDKCAHQDSKWGGSARDSQNNPYSWLVFINAFLGKAARAAMRLTEPEYEGEPTDAPMEEYRAGLLKIAALCVAAIQTLDATVTGDE